MWQNRIALRTGYRMEVGAQTGTTRRPDVRRMGAGTNGMWVDYVPVRPVRDPGRASFELLKTPGFA